MSKYILVAIIGLIISGCGSRPAATPMSDDDTVHSDTIAYSESADTIPDGMVCGVEWIPLRDDGTGIFSSLTKLIPVGDKYVVVSKPQHKIIVYSDKGDHLYTIDKMGRGPEEYLEIAAATATGSSVYIVDNFARKLKRYSIADGSYVGETEMPFVAWDVEALSDDEFLFTCMSVNADAKITPKPIDYAVWRTDRNLEVTDKYIPLEENHVEMIGKMSYFTRDNNGNVVFHTYRYPGFFTIAPGSGPVYHHVEFDKPVADGMTFADAQESGCEYLGETPFVFGDYWVAEIAAGQYGEQKLASNRTGKIYRFSTEWAANLPLDIIGVSKSGLIGYLNDNYDQYLALTQYGFQRADSTTEAHLRDGGAALIKYTMCD